MATKTTTAPKSTEKLLRLVAGVKSAIRAAIDADTTATAARQKAVDKLVTFQLSALRKQSPKGAVTYTVGRIKTAAVYVSIVGKKPGSRADMSAADAAAYDAISWIVRRANAALVESGMVTAKEGTAAKVGAGKDSRKRRGPVTTEVPVVKGSVTPAKVFKSIKGFDMSADKWRELADMCQAHADLIDSAEGIEE